MKSNPNVINKVANVVDDASIANNISDIAKQIKLVIFDVDGVLTNAELFYLPINNYDHEAGNSDLQECKAFNARDGLGMRLLLDAGIDIAIISGNKSKSVNARFEKFNLKHLYQGVRDKKLVFQQIMQAEKLDPKNVAYLGDDLIDLPVMKLVGLPCAVADADSFVKQNALWITSAKGGCGAARELCELILSSKGLLDEIQRRYLR